MTLEDLYYAGLSVEDDLDEPHAFNCICEECSQNHPERLVLYGPACRVCGCTDEAACEGGCFWIEDPEGGDLCSNCAGAPG